MKLGNFKIETPFFPISAQSLPVHLTNSNVNALPFATTRPVLCGLSLGFSSISGDNSRWLLFPGSLICGTAVGGVETLGLG